MKNTCLVIASALAVARRHHRGDEGLLTARVRGIRRRLVDPHRRRPGAPPSSDSLKAIPSIFDSGAQQAEAGTTTTLGLF
jgi:hypothetical protein